MVTSWSSFQNTLRAEIVDNFKLFRPYASGKLEMIYNTRTLPFCIFKYLEAQGQVESAIGSNIVWDYKKFDPQLNKGGKFIYEIDYFVEKTGRWVYFTQPTRSMFFTFFMTFLRELAFLVSYYDRLLLLTYPDGTKKTDTETL